VPINWCRRARPGWPMRSSRQGCCERCGSAVRAQRPWRSGCCASTRYADRLLEDLAELDWPESTLAMQRNWIGRSDEPRRFLVVGPNGSPGQQRESSVHNQTRYPVRRDLHGAVPEHPLVDSLTTRHKQAAVRAYQSLPAARAIWNAPIWPRKKPAHSPAPWPYNPVNGEKIPVWIADYVLSSYGTGAIMAVPATTSAI